MRWKTNPKVLTAQCLAEFMGTMIYVYVNVMSVGTGATGVAVASGLLYTLMILGPGQLSGGIFNPAIGLGFFIASAGQIKIITFLAFLLSELLGGLAGAALVRICLTSADYSNATMTEGVLSLNLATAGIGGGFMIESILTFCLAMAVYVTLANGDWKQHAGWGPVAVGAAVCICTLCGYDATGACMNPARALGPAVIASFYADVNIAWAYHYIYWIGPGVGAVTAAIIYRVLHFLSDQEKQEEDSYQKYEELQDVLKTSESYSSGDEGSEINQNNQDSKRQSYNSIHNSKKTEND
ncbi:aquaporin [Lingula anatina]|uniref:Aquaporin n=1 Tax=Lingula anatina TaxID=7574 RepID=A0A1S3JDI4_LINAN|nr:aquaporin [Lingula anatina]|eukprot:XP_013408467.1 aquaporin [Lingula anatina]